MEDHLRTPGDWHAWFGVLARWPGQGARLDARSSLLAERYLEGSAPDAVRRAMEDAERIEGELRAQDARSSLRVAPPRRRGARLMLSVVTLTALAAGLGLFVRPPNTWLAGGQGVQGPGVRPRGDAAVAVVGIAGTIRFEQAARNLLTLPVGRGTRPELALDLAQPATLRWAGVDGYFAVVWVWRGGAAVRPSDGTAGTEPLPPTGSLGYAPQRGDSVVVVVMPVGGDTTDLVGRVQGGRARVDPGGDAQVLVVDVVAQ